MRLSFSNIGFLPEDDETAYGLLMRLGYEGLEIAPTRFVGDAPYDQCAAAATKAAALHAQYGLCIASMQSMWYGMQGNIFVPDDAARLTQYTEKAILFAQAIGCKSMVFGCPKNRNVPDGKSAADAQPFFAHIAAVANAHGTAIALEANAPVYGTNFINTSEAAFAFAQNIPHLKVNYDFGTVLMNGESLATLDKHLDLVSHVHISEPALAPIARRAAHKELAAVLQGGGYGGFVSAEMATQSFAQVRETAEYLAEVFQ